MLKTSSAPYEKKGFTLIEVLASIALLGTLLSVTLVSIGRETKQTRSAQDRIQALEVANDLLQLWLIDNKGRIEDSEGVVAGHANWRWRLSGRSEAGLEPFGAHVGHLEVYRVSSVDREEEVLASLEFVSNSPTTARLSEQEMR